MIVAPKTDTCSDATKYADVAVPIRTSLLDIVTIPNFAAVQVGFEFIKYTCDVEMVTKAGWRRRMGN